MSSPTLPTSSTGGADAKVRWSYLFPICLIATLGGLLFGYDTGVISGAIEPLTLKFGLNGLMKGWASGCVIIGCAVGVLAVGPISDRFGRKTAMFIAALLFLASSIGTAIPNDIGSFIIFRFIGGLGIGIASISTPMYIAEITPGAWRGRMVAINQIAIVGGLALVYFANYGIAKSGPGHAGVPAASPALEQSVKAELVPTAVDAKAATFSIPRGSVEGLASGMNCALAVKVDEKAKPARVALATITEVTEHEAKATVNPEVLGHLDWSPFTSAGNAWPKPMVQIIAPTEQWNIHTGWRWMFGAGILPSILFGILLIMIPESPRWLIEQKKDAKAEAILAKVAGDAFAASESSAIRESLAGEKGTWGELFSRALAMPLFLGIALAILQQVTGINVFMYFGTTIFNNMSASTGVDAGMLSQAIVGGAGVLFTLIAIAFVDKWGRKPLMILGSMGMLAALLGMGAMAQFLNDPAAASGGMMALIILYMGCFSLSVGPVTWVILSEIYPTAVRGRALGLATCALWLADYAVTQTFPMMDSNPWLVEKFHHAFPFYLYGIFCVILIAVMKFVPETKGKSLEEIEKLWK